MTLAPPHTLGFAFIGKGPINCENKLIEDKGFNKNEQPCGPWQNGINFKRISDNLCLIWQNLLNEQNRDKLVNHISYKLGIACN